MFEQGWEFSEDRLKQAYGGNAAAFSPDDRSEPSRREIITGRLKNGALKRSDEVALSDPGGWAPTRGPETAQRANPSRR